MANQPATLPDLGNIPADSILLDELQVCSLLGYSKSGIRRLRSKKLMPEPFKIGRLKRWRYCDLQAWIEHLAKQAGATSDNWTTAPCETSTSRVDLDTGGASR